MVPATQSDPEWVHTLVCLEVGWGPRGRRQDWDVELGVDGGEILSVEPRFRGLEVVSPLDASPENPGGFHFSHWEARDSRTVLFNTVTFGNPNNSTNSSQGVCLEVRLPPDAAVRARINDQRVEMPLSRLLRGARAGRMGPIPACSYLFHRAPLPDEFIWSRSFEESGERVQHGRNDTYYIRVRQQNDQWAWSSPVFLRS